MTRRSTIWLVVAVLFMLINLAGAVQAVTEGGALHTAAHAVLALVGLAVALRILSRRRAGADAAGATTDAGSRDLADRLTNLEQSIDAVAIEVERVGEGQRYMTRVLTEKDPETR